MKVDYIGNVNEECHVPISNIDGKNVVDYIRERYSEIKNDFIAKYGSDGERSLQGVKCKYGRGGIPCYEIYDFCNTDTEYKKIHLKFGVTGNKLLEREGIKNIRIYGCKMYYDYIYISADDLLDKYDFVHTDDFLSFLFSNAYDISNDFDDVDVNDFNSNVLRGCSTYDFNKKIRNLADIRDFMETVPYFINLDECIANYVGTATFFNKYDGFKRSILSKMIGWTNDIDTNDTEERYTGKNIFKHLDNAIDMCETIIRERVHLTIKDHAMISYVIRIMEYASRCDNIKIKCERGYGHTNEIGIKLFDADKVLDLKSVDLFLMRSTFDSDMDSGSIEVAEKYNKMYEIIDTYFEKFINFLKFLKGVIKKYEPAYTKNIIKIRKMLVNATYNFKNKKES